MVDQAKNYKIAINPMKELLVSVPASMGIPENPSVIYDGGDHALLQRNDESQLLLDYVTEEFRRLAPRNGNVYVAEFNGDMSNNDNMRWVYGAPVKMEEKLPIDPLPRSREEIFKELEDAKANGNLEEVAARLFKEFGIK